MGCFLICVQGGFLSLMAFQLRPLRSGDNYLWYDKIVNVDWLIFIVTGAQQKRAVVQWFSHFTEIPQNKRKLLKREVFPGEVFFDRVSGYDTDIAVETIIKSVVVRTAASLRLRGWKKRKQFEMYSRTVRLLYSVPNKICDVHLLMQLPEDRTVENCWYSVFPRSKNDFVGSQLMVEVHVERGNVMRVLYCDKLVLV